MLRRSLTLAASCCLVLGLELAPVNPLFAQNEVQKAAQPPAKAETKEAPKSTDATKTGETAKKQEAAKDDPAKKDAAKTETPKAVEPPLPPIPPEVQAKIDAARKAVAEAIVAAQDAGLIETSIDPPPVLDLLVNGRVTDARTLKGAKPYGMSPEVFGAWFTGFGKTEGINYEADLRIMHPSAGLKQYYEQRARILEQYIQEARKAKGPAPTPKKEATKPAEATKPISEPAKAPEAKTTEPAKPAEPKKQ